MQQRTRKMSEAIAASAAAADTLPAASGGAAAASTASLPSGDLDDGGDEARVPTPTPQCVHCGATSTSKWCKGPAGPRTLCNVCNCRYWKGKLSPTVNFPPRPDVEASIANRKSNGAAAAAPAAEARPRVQQRTQKMSEAIAASAGAERHAHASAQAPALASRPRTRQWHSTMATTGTDGRRVGLRPRTSAGEGLACSSTVAKAPAAKRKAPSPEAPAMPRWTCKRRRTGLAPPSVQHTCTLSSLEECSMSAELTPRSADDSAAARAEAADLLRLAVVHHQKQSGAPPPRRGWRASYARAFLFASAGD